MPYQGPWSECVHCNNKMLAARKHNASALFWYTQRYHSLRTLEHGLTGKGLRCCLIAYSLANGPGMTGAPDPRAPRLGPRAFSISVVDSFGGGFVW